jgi:TolA-binding protein
MWELDSDFLNIHGDLVIELAQNDSDEAKKEAVEVLISECQEQIDWFNGQIENLNALQEQMRQGEF